MNKTLLTAVSAIALMAAAPAIADTEMKAGVDADVSAKPGSAAAAAQSTGSVKKDIENAWDDVKEDTSEAYKDIKAALINENEQDMNVTKVTINSRTTAAGMIGQPVYNNEERVGKIDDIIVDQNGKAMMVIVADGDFFGTGKLAAFDYARMVKADTNGDIVMPLTEDTIDQAVEFSYNREDRSDNVSVVPSNGYRASELLDGQLTNAKGEVLGQIDDIHFSGGTAAHLIVGFDQVLGLGGEKAALTYGSAKIVPDGDDEHDFQLNTARTAQFESYKNTVAN